MKPVLVYYRGAIIPCWEGKRAWYPVILHPNGPPLTPFEILSLDRIREFANEELAQWRSNLLRAHTEKVARQLEASFWNPPVTR